MDVRTVAIYHYRKSTDAVENQKKIADNLLSAAVAYFWWHLITKNKVYFWRLPLKVTLFSAPFCFVDEI
jgi:hypothetical protein